MGHHKRHSRTHRAAFTLVELIVVIGIIAVLLGLLFPVVAHARFESRMTVCANSEREYLASMLAYSTSNDGFLPRFDYPPGTGDNVQDESFVWQQQLTGNYGMRFESFFCPESPDDLKQSLWKASGFFIGGYNLWIPRKIGGLQVPPEVGNSVLIVNGTSPIRGPTKTSDPIGMTNPVIGDDIIVRSEYVTDPVTFDLARMQMSDYWYQYSAHFYRGHMKASNLGFMDGRVERRDVTQIKLRYRSANAWNAW